MGALVFAIILLLFGAGCFVAALVAMPKKDERGRLNYGRRWTMVAGSVFLVLVPVIFFFAGFNSVPTKSVGVVTSYGKVIGQPYGPGGHWMVPWKSLNIVQDTIQSDNFSQANGSGADQQQPSGIKGYCLSVRLAGLTQACLDVQLQTQVEPSAIPELYANYSSYGPNLTLDVDQYVVQRELKTWLNRDLGDYNVIQDVSNALQACAAKAQTTCNSTAVVSQFGQFDAQVLKSMQQDPELAGKINVLDVNIQYPHFDDNTEGAIQKIQQSYLTTVEATQQEQTNRALSLANAALVQSNSLTPAVLQNNCYATTQDAIKANYSLPAGWSCSGSGSNLILNGK